MCKMFKAVYPIEKRGGVSNSKNCCIVYFLKVIPVTGDRGIVLVLRGEFGLAKKPRSTSGCPSVNHLKLDNFGVYFAKVVSIEENQAVLKNVVVDGIRHDGMGFMGSEDYVNIFNTKDIKILKEKNLQPGCKICFMAQSYEYERKDGSSDFSLCNISDIEIIDDYDIPTKEELINEQIRNLVCEVCLYDDSCDK